jgi:Na+-driven multidrug efflux pump
LKLKLKNLFPDKEIISKILSVGVSPFVMQIMNIALIVITNGMCIKYGGNDALAVRGIIFSIYNLFFMPVMGLNQGIQPLIGYNFGAKNFSRVKDTVVKSILWATVICTAGFFLVFFFNEVIIKLFVKEKVELIAIGANAVRIFLFTLPLMGFQVISTNYFQAVGKPKHAMFLILFRQVFLIVPLIFILPHFFKLNGVWLTPPVSDVIAASVTALLMFYEISSLNEKIKETKVEVEINA